MHVCHKMIAMQRNNLKSVLHSHNVLKGATQYPMIQCLPPNCLLKTPFWKKSPKNPNNQRGHANSSQTLWDRSTNLAAIYSYPKVGCSVVHFYPKCFVEKNSGQTNCSSRNTTPIGVFLVYSCLYFSVFFSHYWTWHSIIIVVILVVFISIYCA